MKTKLQLLRWLMMLMLMSGALGAWAQPYPNEGDDIVCFGSTKHYAVINNLTSTYTWSITPTSGGNGNIIAGQGLNDITVTWTASGICDLQVIETGPNCTGLPVIIHVTVLPQMTAPVITAAQTICYGATPAQLTMPTLPTGGNGTYTYQWQSSPDGTTWTDIAGATGTTYTPSALTATTSYHVIATATGAQSCGVVPTSNVVTITVLPQMTAPVITAAQTICYNTAPELITMPTLPTGGNGTYTYQWQSSPDGTTWTDISGATGTTYAPPALTATTSYQVIATATGAQTCGVVPTSNEVKITVEPQLGTSPIYHN